MRFALVFLLACGATSNSVTVVNVTNNVDVQWGSEGRDDSIDFQDARLQRVLIQLAEVVGHPVDLHFNVAMMPRPTKWFFDSLFERELGQIPRDIERLRDRSPNVFSYGAPRLNVILFDYDGSTNRPDVEHNPETGVVRLRMSRGVPGDAISYALRRSYAAQSDSLFDGKNAEDVSEQELAMYFEWLDSRGMRGPLERRATAMRNAVGVWQRSENQPMVRAQVTDWLVDKVTWFRDKYIHHDDEIARPPVQAPFDAAEAAYATWVNAAWAQLGDSDRHTLLDAMFVRRSGAGREIDPYLRDVYPGVDLFALSMGVLDRWIAAEHPAPASVSREDAGGKLFALVVCQPHASGQRMFDQGVRCDSDLYRWASADSDLRTRLWDEILRRNDARLTEALFANLRWRVGATVVDAWRHFESNLEQWAAASRVVAELIDYGRPDLRAPIYDDAARIWRRSPDKRGSLLYLLAAMSHPRSSRSDMVRWDEFRRVFGGTVSADDFSKFLEHGVGALLRASVVWPARGRASFFQALQPHLERAMDDEAVHTRHNEFPHRTIRELIDAMKAGRDTAGLGQLASFLERRKRDHPSEERLMDTLIQISRSR